MKNGEYEAGDLVRIGSCGLAGLDEFSNRTRNKTGKVIKTLNPYRENWITVELDEAPHGPFIAAAYELHLIEEPEPSILTPTTGA